MEKSRKRFANSVMQNENVIEVKQKIKSINEKDFIGDICLDNFIKISKPTILENGMCIKDNNYKWLIFYNYSSKICLTTIYNNKGEIVEWYFDIARSIGKEKGMPYQDDLYLDVVLRPNGEIILLDEDELKEAFERNEMTKEEYEEAYKIANNLIEKINGKENKIKEFTNKYLNKIS